jgi:hypothetical protein
MPERFATILLPVKKGLHVLRYVSATDMVRPPRVLVMGKPGENEGLSLLFSPDAAESTLARFDDCVAIRATRPAMLMITSMTDPLGISTDVELKLEPIDRVERAATREPAITAPELPVAAPGRFIVEAHLQKQGATRSTASGWVGSASGEDRLDCFGVSWRQPVKGARLSYGCEMLGRGRQVARVPGQIVGAKGQATPIVRVFFELSGSNAQAFEFVLTAAFKGAPSRTVSGTKVELSGPTGQEALVGFSVDLREKQPAERPADEAESTGTAEEREPIQAVPTLVAANQERGRVRVFRGGSFAR